MRKKYLLLLYPVLFPIPIPSNNNPRNYQTFFYSFRVIEMGPSTAQFKVPVLLEVPHFASVRGGERELIVLRCDDGETWREHTTAYLQTGWQGGDEEIYADFVASTGITAAYQELDTSR